MQRKQQGYLTPNEQPPSSLAEAVNRTSVALSVIRQQHLADPVFWIKRKLIEVFSYLGVFSKISEYQVKVLAQRICDKYYYLTPAELDFFFVAFTNGEYRKLYGGDTVNPQDVMMSLIEYEKDVLHARGIAEQKRQAEEDKRQRIENAKYPHGLQAWEIYCRNNGYNPETHTIATVKLRNVNEELYNDKQK